MKAFYLIQLPENFFLWSLLPIIIKAYLIALFCTFMITFLTKVQFFSPLLKFLPPTMIKNERILSELKNYHYTARFLICHGLSSAFSWLVFFLYYQSYYPVFLSLKLYKIDKLLKQSWCLQQDKIDYFLNKVDFSITQNQVDLVNLTSQVQTDFSFIIDQIIKAEPKTNINSTLYLFICSFILLVIFFLLMLIKKKFQQVRLVPYILVIPNFNGLPGWLILKLIYPFIVVCLLSYFVYRWKQSDKDFSSYVGQKLFSDNITVGQAVRNLKMFRYYFVVTFFGGNLVLLLNWFIFLSSFVSYRFSDLGIEKLIEARSEIFEIKKKFFISFKDDDHNHKAFQELEEGYEKVITKLQELELVLQPYYEQQIDPVGELWWLPLIRLFFLLIVLGSFYLSYYFYKKK